MADGGGADIRRWVATHPDKPHPPTVLRCREPDHFVRTFHILREDDEQGLLSPTSHQQVVLNAIQKHRFVLVVKYRQAYISTISIAWLLGQVEYNPGLQGIFMGPDQVTAEDIFRRANEAYERQPAWMRIPATRAGLFGMEFVHGGVLKVRTAGSGLPAIGQSVSRAVFTEFGFWRNQARVIGHLFPTFRKRPNARVIGESTPGSHGCGYHRLVMANYGVPDAQYHVVFLPWWRDLTCVARDPNTGAVLDAHWLTPDNDELRLMEAMPGITRGHLLFRRHLLEGEFDGDARMFENKYPRSVYDGWYTTSTPAFPEEHLKAMIADSLHDAGVDGAWESPIHGHRYLVAADPNSYGRQGDPSSHTVWDIDERREVAAWSGRVDPIAYADILARLGRWFNNAVVAVEANAAACVTALVRSGYRHIWSADDNPDHPGWYRTKNAKDRAHGAFVRQVRDGRMPLRSREGIQQCLAYDGTDKHGNDGEAHHFDRVAAYLIAADILDGYPARKAPPPFVDAATGALTVAGHKKAEKELLNRGRQRL